MTPTIYFALVSDAPGLRLHLISVRAGIEELLECNAAGKNLRVVKIPSSIVGDSKAISKVVQEADANHTTIPIRV